MAPIPTIPNVYRIQVEWDSTVAVTPVNVFHVRALSGTASAIGTAVATALSAHTPQMWDPLYTGIIAHSILVTPLDGTTAGFDVPLGTPIDGGGSGGLLPQVCAVVSLKSTQRGSRGRGRMYVGPVGETQVTDGNLAGTSQSNMLTAWGAFVNSLNSGTPSIQLVIASYKHADAHDVTNIRVDTVCGTQRRRQNQLR